jgi:hypothetical protein
LGRGAVAEQHYTPPMTELDWVHRRERLRELDRTVGVFGRPDDVEPLASRTERAQRVSDCRDMSARMLADWHDDGAPIAFYDGVWTKGICIDFLVFTWKGVFCVWSVDHRWTVNQAAIVQPARTQIQAELPGWRGRVEAVFHSPRQQTSWNRQVMVHPVTNEPVEIVIIHGRIDEVLFHWEPFEGQGLDPEWITWLCRAATPRWWRSDEGRIATPPGMPPEEEL